MNPSARRAQIDIRRSAVLIALVLSFLLGVWAGQATTTEARIDAIETAADLATDTPSSEILDVECDPATPGCVFEADGQWFATDTEGISTPIHEDSPLWDCTTMGNRVCGPGC